jgi:phosphoribosylanthranilate isomerase
MRYSKVADMLLFDAKAPETSALPGGNGLVFDWNLLAGRSFTVPWMLSGGLNVDNLQEAVTLSGATIVDTSSSVEVRPGVKSPALIEAFIRRAKEL